MKVWKLIKQNPILSVLTALALAAPIAWVAIGTNSLPLIAASFVIYFTFALAVLVPKDEHYSMFKALVVAAVPLGVLAVIVGHHQVPVRMDEYSYEDGLIETISASVLFAGAFLWFGYGAMQLRKRRWLVVLAAVLMAGMMGLIGLEEISWGQRILEVESSEFFKENNMQGETNLHNINTALSETVFYAGGIIFLIILPFYRRHIAAAMKKVKVLAPLEPFLPSAWLSVPFGALLGFMGGWNVAFRPLLLFLYAFGFAALVVFIMRLVRQRQYIYAAGVGLVVIIALAGDYTFLTFNAELLQVRSWYYTEYLELFIEVGLLIYTIDFMFRRATLLKGYGGEQAS